MNEPAPVSRTFSPAHILRLLALSMMMAIAAAALIYVADTWVLPHLPTIDGS